MLLGVDGVGVRRNGGECGPRMGGGIQLSLLSVAVNSDMSNHVSDENLHGCQN